MSDLRTEDSYEFRPVFWFVLQLTPSLLLIKQSEITRPNNFERPPQNDSRRMVIVAYMWIELYLILHLRRIVPSFGPTFKILFLNFGIQNETLKPQNFQ